MLCSSEPHFDSSRDTQPSNLCNTPLLIMSVRMDTNGQSDRQTDGRVDRGRQSSMYFFSPKSFALLGRYLAQGIECRDIH